MAPETQLLWTIAVGTGAVVVAVVLILLGLLRTSVRNLDRLVGDVWSSAVGVFVHTVTAPDQLAEAERSAQALR